MNKYALIIVTLLCITPSLFAFERVPKELALESGWVYTHSNDISGINSSGFTVMFDYAWQLSGLDGTRAATFISVPLGYTYFPQDSSIGILSYGWTVRHNLVKNKPVTPFLGYGLLLNQLQYEGDVGKRFGHQTRFDVGCEWNQDKPFRVFTKAEWSMARFPDRDQEESDWFYTIALKVGVRYHKPPRGAKDPAPQE